MNFCYINLLDRLCYETYKRLIRFFDDSARLSEKPAILFRVWQSLARLNWKHSANSPTVYWQHYLYAEYLQRHSLKKIKI